MSLSLSRNKFTFQGSALERNVRRTFDSSQVVPADDGYEVYETEYETTDDVYHVALQLHMEVPGTSPPGVLWDIETYGGGDYDHSVGVPDDDYRFYNDSVSGKELFTLMESASAGAKIKSVRFFIRSSPSASYTIPSGTIVTLGLMPNQGVLDSASA